MVHGDENFFFTLNLKVSGVIKREELYIYLSPIAYIFSQPINDH